MPGAGARLGLMLFAASVAVALGLPAAARSSVTIGSDLSHAGNADHNCGTGCTVIQTASPVGPLSAPSDGLIVRWRVRDFPTANVSLRVVHQVAPGGPPYNDSFIRSSPTETSGGGGVQTFTPTSPIPISTGDSIGITSSVDVTGACGLGTGYSDGIWAMPADGTIVASFNINGQGCDWLYNADIVAPPTSSARAANCPGGSSATVTVTPDPDPATGPKDVHYTIDGGPELTVGTTGDPGVATIPVPNGVHSLEFWGEDLLGQQETTHHSITVGCPSATGALTALHSSPSMYKLTGRKVNGRCVTRTAENNNKAHCTRPVREHVSYTLTARATVTFTLKRLSPGRKVNGRCVKRTSENKNKQRCTRTAPVRGSFSRTGKTGTNSFTFTGKIGGRKLGPGAYELIATSRGSSRTVKFRLVR
jgi:hypothetical protein